MVAKNITIFKSDEYIYPVTREFEERIMDYCMVRCEYYDWKGDTFRLQNELDSLYIAKKEKEFEGKFIEYSDVHNLGLSENEIHFYSIMACGRTGNYDVVRGILKTDAFISVFQDAFNIIAITGGRDIRNDVDEIKKAFTDYLQSNFRISDDGVILKNRTLNLNASRRNVMLAIAYKVYSEKGISIDKIVNDIVCDYIYWMLSQSEDCISEGTSTSEQIRVKGQDYLITSLGSIIKVFKQPKGRVLSYRDHVTMLFCVKEVNVKVAASYIQHMLEKYCIDVRYDEYDVVFNSTGKEKDLDIITEEDVIVKSSVRGCSIKGHELIDLRAIITVINGNGEKVINKVHAGYCRQCNEYFILNADYEYLSGIPLCKVYTVNKLKRLKQADTPYGGFAAQSIMNAHGYNVNENANLTPEQRRTILVSLLNSRKITQEEMLSHLDWLINTNKTKERWEQAVKKWKEDRDFIANYVVSNPNEVGVKSITKYVYIDEQ